MKLRGKAQNRSAESGSALVTGLVTVVVLLGMSAAVMTITLEKTDERTAAVDSHRALNVANAGVAHALTNISEGNTAAIGSEEDPFAFSDGGYWVTLADQGDGTWLVTSTGRVRSDQEIVQAVIQSEAGGVFDNAIFAGNSSGDPLYTLGLGGSGGQRDEINGDVYASGNVTVSGDAEVDGQIRAAGSITGADGIEGAAQYAPDLYAMKYSETADIKVAEAFDSEGVYKSSSAGGSAWQLAEEHPAHIFRKNPSDRKTEYLGTVKDDYFLEDPYEKVNGGMTHSDSNAYRISFSGEHGEPGESGNEKVYYIDGNLWIHNKNTYSLQVHHNPGGTRALFVVKGNIYFSDNLFYNNKVHDALAFVAMKDDDVVDSGNIYFGDPVFGTLNRMNAYMYAENNFYDLNLDESGSEEVYVWGTMSAGNQVVITRDYVTKGSVRHTKLSVDFDERVSNGLEIPGLPGTGESEASRPQVVAWRRVGEAQLVAGNAKTYSDYEDEDFEDDDVFDTVGDVADEAEDIVDDVADDVGQTVEDIVGTGTKKDSGGTKTRGNDWGDWSSWKKGKSSWW